MDDDTFGRFLYAAIALVALLTVFNQYQLASLTLSPTGAATLHFASGSIDLSAVDVNQIQSTPQGIAALFPIGEIKTVDDAIRVMVPTGTPAYGEAMGVSFDDPVTSLNVMARSWNALKPQVQANPEKWQRFLNLAAQPRGVSCEYCCGIGPVGADANGNSRCGCQHNPAVLTLTGWLLLNTEYSDAEILYEVYRWKTLFFPKNMVGIAAQIAGGDTSVLDNLPGMVGGC